MLHISNIKWDVTDGAEDMTKKRNQRNTCHITEKRRY